MKLNNWLERHYPEYKNLIRAKFTDEDIEIYLKNNGYKICVLVKDFKDYSKGTIILYKKSGRMYEGTWDGTYSNRMLIKCEED